MPYFRLFYHFVWTTKQRLPLINDKNREPIYAAIRTKTTQLNGTIHALNGMADHVHLVVSLPPTIAPSSFVGQIKGISSHLASHLNADDDPFAWQDEYGVLSVSESHLPSVVSYVDMQQQHHASQKLNAKLEPNW
jgi:putative transposase